ncbi:MAG: transposase family protein [Spirosomaceae bacterium]|jgi:hypothetical protein|nr:transposase family protein [Spirosomataceae bacterium]
MTPFFIPRYEDSAHDETQFKRLTGLKKSEFERLHQRFREDWLLYFSQFTLEGKLRVRQASHRKNRIFEDTKEVLFFGLIYLKGNILQEHLAEHFEIDQPKASRYLTLIRKILNEVLSKHANLISKRKRQIFLT